MNKLLIALPLLAGTGAVAVAGTSQYAGSRTQVEYKQLLVQMNDMLPFKLVNETYDSGLTSSSAITKVMSSPAADAEILFRLHHDIQHAPVRTSSDGVKVGQVSISTTLLDSDIVPTELLDALSDAKPFELRTDVSYSGDTRHQLNVSGFEMNEDGTEFSWSGISFDAATDNGNTVGSGSMGVLSVNDIASGGLFSVASSPFSVDIHDIGDMLYIGKVGFAFNDVKLVSADIPAPILVASIGVDSDTSMEAGSLSSFTQISVKGIDSPVPINGGALDVTLDGLDVEGVRQFQGVMNNLSVDLASVMNDPELLLQLTNAFQSMVKPGSALKYALNLNNDEGDVDANIHFGLKNESEEGMSAGALSNVVTGRDLLNILSFKATLDADVQALAQTPVMMLLGGIGEFVTVTDESITSEVSLNGTTLVVNGMELPLDIMVGGMLDVPLVELAQL